MVTLFFLLTLSRVLTVSSFPSQLATPQLSDFIIFAFLFQPQDTNIQKDEDYDLLPAHHHLLSSTDGPSQYRGDLRLCHEEAQGSSQSR